MHKTTYLTADGRRGQIITNDEGRARIQDDKIRRVDKTERIERLIESTGATVAGTTAMTGLRIGRRSFLPFNVS